MSQWRPIVGFEGLYSVSDLGNVRSEARVVPFVSKLGMPTSRRTVARVLKNFDNGAGYPTVCLGRGHKATVHTLVLAAFIGPRPPGAEACHDNGNQGDCRLANLRWDSRQGNRRDMVRHGTQARGEGSPVAKLTEAEARAIKTDARSQREIAAVYGIGQMQVSRIKRGVRWAHL